MLVKKLFNIGGIIESGPTIFLNGDNCQIFNKTKKKDAVILNLKRQSDGQEGKSYLHVMDEYKEIESSLLKWAFVSVSIVGLTLNQLRELDIDLEIERIGNHLQLKGN